jgi:hypothetical protein
LIYVRAPHQSRRKEPECPDITYEETTDMTGGKKYRFEGDPLLRRDSDPGYQVGWRHKVRFEKGHLEGEMSYGEASRRAAELQTKDTEGKVYFPEMLRTLEG